MTSKYLFCNIGWMANYNGIDGDTIERGGGYNSHSTGHEVCNFSDSAGTLYGYVQPTGQIKLEKLGGRKDDESVDGVTVIWTAGPGTGGTVVIGWYHNATVFRSARKIVTPTPAQKRNGISTYRISAPTASAVLLPIDDRKLLIPRAVKGGIGQSNVWYAQTPESKEIVKRVFDLIKLGQTENLPDVDLIDSALEGNPRFTAHLQRERSASLVKAKKYEIKKLTGKLCCEACGFDFKERYGEHGEDFCEVHHLLPLSKTDGVVKTNLSDLAIVCSNCHRIIHRSVPMLTISKLRKILKWTGS
jgi:5-methylcytosine-specific restriction protein A